MEKEGKTSASLELENNLHQIPDDTIINHSKSRYLFLVSQTSLSFNKNKDNTENILNIQNKNDKTALIAADLVLQYLQRRNMSLTLNLTSSESNNLLVRHFEDRWLAREVQVRGKHDVLHGLIVSKKNNTFGIGFGSNFMKKKKEEEDRKYRSNTFRSKSLPAGTNLLNNLKELDKNEQNNEINNKLENQQNSVKQIDDLDKHSISNRSKSSKSSKAKKPRKSYQGLQPNQNIIDDNENEFKNNSSNFNHSESQPSIPKVNQTESQNNKPFKRYSKHQVENEGIELQDDISNNQSQSQKTSNGSGSNNINYNTTNSNILPSPLKTTYSGREDDNISNDFDNDEIKTHTYQYSTIYSEDEATHVTEYEYETIEQLTESNDYNSKTNEYTYDKDISPKKSSKSNQNLNTNQNDNYNISSSPNINNYTSAYYEYYSYTTNNENRYSNNDQDQQINNIKTTPPKKKQQQEDLQLEFPFVQSRDAKISSSEEDNKQNSQPQQKKHHDYYYHRHSKKDKLGFSAPVEFDNPAENVEIKEEGNVQIETIEKVASKENDTDIIEEEEEVKSDDEKSKVEEASFFIFHAVDIEPDLALQKLFRSKAKQNKSNFSSSLLDEVKILSQNDQKEHKNLQNSEKTKYESRTSKKSPDNQNSRYKNNQSDSNLKKPKIEERGAKVDSLIDFIDRLSSISENQKERKAKKSNKRTEDEEKTALIDSKKNHNRNTTHKHHNHGSIKRGSQIISNINSKISGISNIDNHHNDNNDLASGVSSLVTATSSSASNLFSNAYKTKSANLKNADKDNDQISIEKNRKTKFSNKLQSSRNDSTNKINKHSSQQLPLKKGKNTSASFSQSIFDIEISDTSNAGLSIDKICEAISEDELLEMSDAPSVSFD